jgi:hypothetical protein
MHSYIAATDMLLTTETTPSEHAKLYSSRHIFPRAQSTDMRKPTDDVLLDRSPAAELAKASPSAPPLPINQFKLVI